MTYGALETSVPQPSAAALARLGRVPTFLAAVALAALCVQAAMPALLGPGSRLALILAGFVVAVATGAAWIAAWVATRSRRLIDDLAHAAHERGARKDAFLAGLSHELRTPLNVVVGYASLLLDPSIGALAPEQQDIVTRITSNARNLSHMINDLVDVSRIEAGRVVLQLAPVDVRPVLSELIGAAELLRPGTDVELGWSVADDCPPILADPTRLHQVLSNLVVNAVKFTEHGSIRLHAEPDGAGRVVISVADTGIGIPPEVRAALFDPAHRAPDPRHQIPGSGIGLAIAAKLAGLMNAELRVASEPGEGTHFALSVPAATASARPGPVATARAA